MALIRRHRARRLRMLGRLIFIGGVAAERFSRGRPALWVRFPCSTKGAGASTGFDSRAVARSRAVRLSAWASIRWADNIRGVMQLNSGV